MSHIPLLHFNDAPNDVKDLYEDFGRRMSFPSAPNFIMTQGHSLTVTQGTWDVVRNVLVSGKLPRWVKEMIFVAISRDRKCHYCEAAHTACCRMLGVDRQLLESLVRNVNEMADNKARDMILFAVKCSRTPQEMTATDFEKLRQHGLGHTEVIELIGMSALAVYANIIADATAMEADAMFETIDKPKQR